ncbi:MAG: DEAD/DEAH box helicase family protein [Candidatus Sericytochromatia bacterium]|nr:DEAD/DEAH box helicase family protein [Candidatus Tanganyikabacteria bacterium]
MPSRVRHADASPILGSPYAEPTAHWAPGPELRAGRRPAGDPEVDGLRRRVAAWRGAGYPGATAVTRRLLARWSGGERLFFAQREAIETVIYLHECAPPEARLRDGAIPRMACSLATGAGKTAVMAALIAWSGFNRQAYPRDSRFPEGILVIAPNVMVRERLGDLRPARGEGSVYRGRDLVAPEEMVALRRARLVIRSWHALMRRDLGEAFGVAARVVARGTESDEVLARRVVGRAGRLLVLNDEAHHAHRSAAGGKATVWAEGLDALHAARGIGLCVDLTATPLDAGSAEPLPWVVSRFPLADAIEAGIVKIPQQPIAMPRLPWSRGAASILAAARPALDAMAERNRATAARWADEAGAGKRPPAPPVLAVVCRDLALARAVHAYLGATYPDFADAVRLDSGTLDEGQAVARHLRWTGLTVGLAAWPGGRPPAEYALLAEGLGLDPAVPPGRDVRCVVSVAMLAEGWDAPNVAQLVGLRPFGSALLVEQVLGRGLRRSRPGAWGAEEAVDVCGIPLADLPVRADPDRPERDAAPPPAATPAPAWHPARVAAAAIALPAEAVAAAWEAAPGTGQQRRFAAALALTAAHPEAGPPHAVFPAALAQLPR